jgi:GNAT superfamily N-acetyltransferase
VQSRRDVDDITMRLSLESAERGTAWVARDDQEVVGIAVAHDWDDERHIGDLFVERSYRGHGVGAALVEAAFAEVDLGRTALVAARDPAALALPLRFGMALREPVLRFAGAIPNEEMLAKMASGDYRFTVDTIEPSAHRFALDELDRLTLGTSRPADHTAFAPASCGNAFFVGGECVGYAYVWPDGHIGPLACASEAYLVQVFAYSLVTLTRSYGASWCTVLVPGSNRRIARTALRAGLRVNKTFTFASDSPAGDRQMYVGYHEMLF